MRRGVVLLLVCGALALNGCALLVVGAAAAAGAGVAYVEGEGRKTYDAGLDRAYAATLKALNDIELIPYSKKKDFGGAELRAQTALEKEVIIRLAPVSPNATEVRVRVGVFGDENVANVIYDAIDKRVK